MPRKHDSEKVPKTTSSEDFSQNFSEITGSISYLMVSMANFPFVERWIEGSALQNALQSSEPNKVKKV